MFNETTGPDSESAPERIVRVTREHLFNFGYAALTMDELAHELGMSKKTLYLHFPSKEAIIDAIADQMAKRITGQLDHIVANPDRTFCEKLHACLGVIGTTLSRVGPRVLRDLQRYVPAVYAKIDEMRQRNIPHYFGKLIREGQKSGWVRAHIDPDFAAQFWLQAIRGLLQPDVMERTQRTPQQILESASELFFFGILTPAGLKDYEKVFSPRK